MERILEEEEERERQEEADLSEEEEELSQITSETGKSKGSQRRARNRARRARARARSRSRGRITKKIADATLKMPKDAISKMRKLTSWNKKEPPPTEPEERTYYTIQELRSKSVPGSNSATSEMYLSPSDFLIHFGMNKDEYAQLPAWQRVRAKRDAGL